MDESSLEQVMLSPHCSAQRFHHENIHMDVITKSNMDKLSRSPDTATSVLCLWHARLQAYNQSRN